MVKEKKRYMRHRKAIITFQKYTRRWKVSILAAIRFSVEKPVATHDTLHPPRPGRFTRS
jgi:hypothetical protein